MAVAPSLPIPRCGSAVTSATVRRSVGRNSAAYCAVCAGYEEGGIRCAIPPDLTDFVLSGILKPKAHPMSDLLARITIDPDQMHGRACIRGLRITVADILGMLSAGQSRDEILGGYPYLE